jgi:formylmethanofuran dehydrogenase subunit A
VESGAEAIVNYVNAHSHVTLDMGQVIFTDTTTMTADGPFQYTLHELSGNKWVNHDVETETSSGIVPFQYRRKSYVHSIQWSIGLELALLIKDPWKIFMTTDHPNAGPFTAYPKIIAWLMSRKAREATLRRINSRARSRSLLPSIDRELDFYEIAIMTRAGQAKALGLKHKGHLGIGADADIAIYNVNPEKTNPSRKYKIVRRAFKKAAYTIKDGKIVVKNGEILKHVEGATMWLNVQTSEPAMISDEMKRRFREYWTVEYENYPVTEDYLKVSNPIAAEASV